MRSLQMLSLLAFYYHQFKKLVGLPELSLVQPFKRICHSVQILIRNALFSATTHGFYALTENFLASPAWCHH